MENKEKKQEKINYLIDEFFKVAEKGKEIHVEKTHDYGTAFYDAVDFAGLQHASGILYQKIRRVNELLNSEDGPMVKDESIEDSLIDLSNYALMTVVKLREDKKLKS